MRFPTAWISAAASRPRPRSACCVIERDEAILKDRREGLVALYEATGRVATPSEILETAEARQLQALRTN